MTRIGSCAYIGSYFKPMKHETRGKVESSSNVEWWVGDGWMVLYEERDCSAPALKRLEKKGVCVWGGGSVACTSPTKCEPKTVHRRAASPHTKTKEQKRTKKNKKNKKEQKEQKAWRLTVIMMAIRSRKLQMGRIDML